MAFLVTGFIVRLSPGVNVETPWLMANLGAYWSLADNGKLEISHI
jgi:hypothetical protein